MSMTCMQCGKKIEGEGMAFLPVLRSKTAGDGESRRNSE